MMQACFYPHNLNFQGGDNGIVEFQTYLSVCEKNASCISNTFKSKVHSSVKGIHPQSDHYKKGKSMKS